MMACTYIRSNKNCKLIVIGFCLAVVYTLLKSGDNEPKSSETDIELHTQVIQLQNNQSLVQSSPVNPSKNITDSVSDTNAFPKSKGHTLSNKKLMYNDKHVNENLNAMEYNFRQSEEIKALINASYIKVVSDQITDPKNAATLPFLENYHNPCWFESLNTWRHLYDGNPLVKSALDKVRFSNTLNDNARVYEPRVNAGNGWRLRCIPYFYIIGFAKCGTTDLFMRLQDHQQVTNGLKKEIHWWSEARHGRFWRTKSNKVPLRDYVDLFDVAAENIRVYCTKQISNTTQYHPCVMGEGSITTVYSNPMFRQTGTDAKIFQPAEYMVPAMMKHLIPNVKIIVMLRNPVDRLYSSYIYFGSQKVVNNKDFHSRVVKGIQIMQRCINNNGDRSCVYDLDLKNKIRLSLGEGMYSVFLRDWFEVYDKTQIRVIKMEEYSTYKEQILQDTVKFLELDPYEPDILKKSLHMKAENSMRSYNSKRPGILPETEKLLQSFYKPYIEDLVQLMGEDKWRFF